MLDAIISFLSTPLIYLSSGDIIWRVIHFIEEIISYRDRYDGVLQIIKLVFSGSSWSLFILGYQALACIYSNKYDVDLCQRISQSIGFGLIYCIFKWRNDNSPLASINWLRKSRGLDCGTNMACSFFKGYLNIILPNKGLPGGNGTKCIVERIKDFEDTEGIEIPLRKLILLLPRDLYSPPLLSDFNDDIIKIDNLEFTLRDRAGTTNRHYSNTVYKILSKNYYVVAEAATPLLTHFEKHKNDQRMKSHFREIYEKFYKVLEELLNSSPECRETCILVPYSGRTPSGTMTNVAKVISDVVEEQLRLNSSQQ